MAKEQPPWLREVRAIATSRRGVSIAKGVLAYALAFILVFLRDFDDLNVYPVTLASMFIIVIAGQPGKTVGLALYSMVLAGSGVLIGCLNFFILAKLVHATVAQAFVFAFMVYILAWIKSLGPQYFAFSLLAILMSFNGIYTSYVLGGKFDKKYLFAYLESYLWGIAITAFVSLCVFPITAERELRKVLIVSMEHMETFGMLISKSYLMIITPEEKILRDSVAQTIRADIGLLNQKLNETTLEINWSRWSLDDYRVIIGKIRAVQQALISTHSSVTVLEKKDDELYKRTFVPKSLKSYSRVRLDLRLALQDIKTAFGADPTGIPRCMWDTYMDMENQAAAVHNRFDEPQVPIMADGSDRTEQLRAVARRLAAEFENVDQDSTDDSDTANEDRKTESATVASTPGVPASHSPIDKSEIAHSPPKSTSAYLMSHEALDKLEEKEKAAIQKAMANRGAHALTADFKAFSDLQYDLITKAITGGTLTDCTGQTELRIHAPQPSVFNTYGNDYVRGKDVPASTSSSPLLGLVSGASSLKNSGPSTPNMRRRKVRVQDPVKETAEAEDEGSIEDDNQGLDDEEVVEQTGNHSLLMVYSLLFALGQYVQELTELHERVTSHPNGAPRKKRLHFHFFESLAKPEVVVTKEGTDEECSLAEAIALLESKPYTKRVITWADRVHQIRMLMFSDNSLFAAKTAAAASVFAIFIYAKSTRAWFISYSLSGGLLTVIVALAPTLGQSALTFILQIAGSAIGYLMGLAILSIFHNVGGYVYNPYGVTVLMAIYSIPLLYIIYEKPKFFPLALLAMNGSGVLVVTEWVYRDYYNRPTFDRPAYRTGKALASLAIAVAICGIFQLFVARNPARRTLRKALAHLTYSNLAYLTLLQAFVRAVVPADPKHTVPQAAVVRVHKELKKRELQIQAQIINMMPLLVFAKAEPSIHKPFNPALTMRAIKANQVILDRLREGRAAIGTTRLDEVILTNFVAIMSPYRRRSTTVTKSVLGMCAASLTSKLPLPQDLPWIGRSTALADFVHDALVLSYRFARTEEGRQAVRSGEFTRYWFLVLSTNSIFPQLEELEAVVKGMFGKLEDSLA
ncbi:hypothetical protein FRB94_000915 [Tulasnella sp. JGI-2019a]|nr:hypothetical protein FRB93_002630 [Tulasnella sp. JGI-2019a]KAG9006220.1 hypothetical protein FRB94_000915 [Tulasnella sp. JGI-2019a]KAG9033314.1 hypothetical protein FRB95_000321 [Tulasnella sp. JGI-2019a]